VHQGVVGGTGVVGVLSNGDRPTVLLRADMDTLPVREMTGMPYASTATTTDGSGNQAVMHVLGPGVRPSWPCSSRRRRPETALAAWSMTIWSGSSRESTWRSLSTSCLSQLAGSARTPVRSCPRRTVCG
jgi:hypothetical protein